MKTWSRRPTKLRVSGWASRAVTSASLKPATSFLGSRILRIPAAGFTATYSSAISQR